MTQIRGQPWHRGTGSRRFNGRRRMHSMAHEPRAIAQAVMPARAVGTREDVSGVFCAWVARGRVGGRRSRSGARSGRWHLMCAASPWTGVGPIYLRRGAHMYPVSPLGTGNVGSAVQCSAYRSIPNVLFSERLAGAEQWPGRRELSSRFGLGECAIPFNSSPSLSMSPLSGAWS